MNTTQFNSNVSNINDLLFGFAMKLTKNRENAKDLMQETLMRAFDKRDRFQLNTNFKAWVTTIMYNSYINVYRRRKTRNKVETPMEICTQQVSIKAHSGNIVSDMSMKELVGIIDTLNESSKVPFLLFYKGFSYDEIAERLSLPIGTVKSRIFHARKKLRERVLNTYGHHPLRDIA